MQRSLLVLAAPSLVGTVARWRLQASLTAMQRRRARAASNRTTPVGSMVRHLQTLMPGVLQAAMATAVGRIAVAP